MKFLSLKKFNIDSKSIKVNAIFNAIYQILVLLAPLITTPYISRVLGVEAIGNYQYCNSIVNYFTLLSAYGFSTFGTQKIAEVRDDKEKRSNVFWNIMFSKSLVSALCLAVYLIVTLILFDGAEMMMFMAMTLYIVSVLIDPTFYFQGRENFVSISIRNIIVRIFTIALIFILIKSPDDVVYYALILSSSNFLAAFIIYFSFRKSISKPNFNECHILKTFKEAFPYFMPELSVALFTSLNQTLLGAITGSDAQSGYYAQAVKFSNLISAFAGSLSIIMLSRVSYLHSIHDEAQIGQKVRISFHALWVIGLPCVFGICAISNVLIPVFLGEGYEPVVYLLYIVASIGILSPLNSLYGNVYFKAYRKIWYQVGILLFAAVVSIVINLLLDSRIGAYGCAIASLAAETCQVPLLMFFSRKTINHKELFKTVIKPLDSAMIMLIVILIFNNFVGSHLSLLANLLLDIVIGIIVYGVCILVFKDDFAVSLVKLFTDKIKDVSKKLFKRKN